MNLAGLRARQPGASLRRIMWWYGLHGLCYTWVGSCFGYRAWGVHHIPRTGPVLLVSNHQSFLDPILVGLAGHHRQFYAMARSTLFNKRAFAWLIRSLNAIPVERGSGDMAAMRRSIEVLQQGHALLLFPEGTRTADGAVGSFHHGIMLLIKRARPQVVPVAIEGSYEAWPRKRMMPRLTGKIGVMFGPTLPAEKLISMGQGEGPEYLRDHVNQMRLRLQRWLSSGVR